MIRYCRHSVHLLGDCRHSVHRHSVHRHSVHRHSVHRHSVRSPCPRGSHAHIWSICGPIFPNDLNMLKTMIWGALLVATSLLNTYKFLLKLDKNWLSYEQNTICPYLGIRTKYYRFWPINWANINIFQ